MELQCGSDPSKRWDWVQWGHPKSLLGQKIKKSHVIVSERESERRCTYVCPWLQ